MSEFILHQRPLEEGHIAQEDLMPEPRAMYAYISTDGEVIPIRSDRPWLVPAYLKQWGINRSNRDNEPPGMLHYTQGGRMIARDEVGEITISTVFLGMNHGWGGKDLWFETLVFDDAQYCERYETLEQAQMGHDNCVLEYRLYGKVVHGNGD